LFLRKQKEALRRQQETNVAKKREAKEEHKQRSLEGIRRKLEEQDNVEEPESKTGSGGH